MAPAIEPKRRVKSIRKPGDNPMAKLKKPKGEKQFSRAYINKLLKKVLKRRANTHDSVHLIYKTYRRMIKMACELVARRHRKITIKEAHVAMAKLIPRDVAMNAIREFRQQPVLGDMGPPPVPPAPVLAAPILAAPVLPAPVLPAPVLAAPVLAAPESAAPPADA